MIILIIGLSGSGKTTLANALLKKLDAIHLNGDVVRETLSSDLSFSHIDRIEHARRMGAVAGILDEQGKMVVVDFICPTQQARESFGHYDLLVWMRRKGNDTYKDTLSLWEDPNADIEIHKDMALDQAVSQVLSRIKG